MRVAVVGSGGFIGGCLTQALLRHGHEVCAVSSRSDGFDAETGIMREPPAPAGPLDALIYLAQSPHYRDVPRHAGHLWAVNVVSAIRATDWARRHGARRVIHASTGNVYQPSFAPYREGDPVQNEAWYPLSKRHAEEALQLFDGLSVTSARLFGVYGPGQRLKLVPNLVGRIQSGYEVALAPHPERGRDGGLHLSMIHVDDAVAVFLRLLDGGPPVLNVAGPEIVSVEQIATAIGGVLGVAPRLRFDVPPRTFDLVADVSAAVGLVGDSFVPFATGIEDAVREIATAAPQ
jgi:UDP-glucose 4-epimerase